jgi:ABC-type branched-subunit amino acid transport system ATPase component
MLSVQDIHTYYSDSYILQGVSLELNPRQVVALLGRNGVGKTTLARSIMGLTPPKRGRILFKQIDITRSQDRATGHRLGAARAANLPFAVRERTFGSHSAWTGRLERG